MEITDKDIRKVALILLIAVLGILVFLIIKPVLLSIIGGLILAYVFYPLYRWLIKFIKYKNLAAALVSILVLLIIFIPLYFLTPIMAEKVFDLFRLSQTLDMTSLVRQVLPAASDQLINQISATLNNAIAKISSSLLSSLVTFLIDFAVIILHVVIVAIVFFFALRDGSKLADFVSALSPLNKIQEKVLVAQFEDMTKTVIYGQVIVGLVQGILAGIGLLVFNVPNALLLTVIATILSIIPLIGPSLIYIPATIYLGVTGEPFLAILYLLYNLLIVSTVDNLIRSHLISRKTKAPQAIILVGMISGLFVFGLLGIIIGPLVLIYFITFLKAYKEKTLSSLFSGE